MLMDGMGKVMTVILIAVLVCLYVQHHLRHSHGISIWQMPLTSFTSEALHHKQPIVIDGFHEALFKQRLPIMFAINSTFYGVVKITSDAAVVMGPTSFKLLHANQGSFWKWKPDVLGGLQAVGLFEQADNAEYTNMELPHGTAIVIPRGWIIQTTNPYAVSTLWSPMGAVVAFVQTCMAYI
jgi:hypothetical protein